MVSNVVNVCFTQIFLKNLNVKSVIHNFVLNVDKNIILSKNIIVIFVEKILEKDIILKIQMVLSVVNVCITQIFLKNLNVITVILNFVLNVEKINLTKARIKK